MHFGLFFILFLFFISTEVRASEEVAQSFTLDGRLYADAAATTPLLDSVSLKVQILNPAESCILYEETQATNTTASNGYYTVHVGLKQGAGLRTSGDTNNPLSTVFSNAAGAITGKLVADGVTPCSYTPAVGHTRAMKVTVTPSDNIPRTTVTNMVLDSVPTALVAERAESLRGLSPSSFLQVNSLGSQVLTQTNLESIFTATNFTNLTNLLAVPAANIVQTGANGTARLPIVAGDPASGQATGQVWYDSVTNKLKYYNGTSAQVVGGGTGTVTSVGSGAGLTGGPITGSGTLAVDVGTAAGQIVQVQTGGKLPALDGSNLTTLSSSGVAAGGGFVKDGNSFAAAATLGTNDAYALNFETNNTTRMTIDSAGKVGIGTTAPTSKFEVVDGNIGIRSGTLAPSIQIWAETANTLPAQLNFLASRAAQSRPQTNDVLGQITFSPLSDQSAAIKGIATEGHSSGVSSGGALTFETTPNTTVTSLERMRIDQNGKIGIGTTTPNATVEIVKNQTTPTQLQISNTSTGNAANAELRTYTDTETSGFAVGSYGSGFSIPSFIAGKSGMFANTTPIFFAAPASTNFTFNTVAGAELVRINGDGKVGVGTTAPLTKLHVGYSAVDSQTAATTIAGAYYVGVGAAEWETNSYRLIGLGYREQSLANFPAFMGFQETDSTSNTFGDLIFGTRSVTTDTAPSERLRITSAGNVGINTTAPVAKLQVGSAPTATANYPLFAMGTAAFDGSTAGFFTGNANGTFVGVNAVTGYTGDFANFQVNGVSKYKVDNTGNVTTAGTTSSTGNISTSGNLSTTVTGTITSAGAITAGSGAASTSPTTGSLIVTGGAGVSGALNVGTSITANGNITTAAGTAATAVANQNSSTIYLSANYWDGAATAVDQWGIQNVLGTGTNPSSTLTFGHTGSTGGKAYAFLSGSVGIGTTTPGAPFDVVAAHQPLASTNGIAAISSSDAMAIDKGGTLSFGGKYDGSVNYKTFGMIGGFKENGTSGNEAGYLGFATRVNGSLPAERMRLTSVGYLGIGTTAPANPLHVLTTVAFDGVNPNVATFSNSAEDTVVAFSAPNAKGTYQIFRNGSDNRWITGKSYFNDDFIVERWVGSNSNAGRAFTVRNSDGNVGIGTDAPQSTLQIGPSGNFPSRFGTHSTGANNWMGAYLGMNLGWDGSNWTTLTDSASSGGAMVTSDAAGNMRFYTYPSAGGTNQSITDATIENYRRMTVTNLGYVGIGTASPQTQLEVVDGKIGIRSATQNPTIQLWGQGSSNIYPTVSLTRSGTNGTTFPQQNDILGDVTYNGHTGAISASVIAVAAENQTLTKAGAFLAFRTAPIGSNNVLERMRIADDGKVGIANTLPNYTLDVTGDINATGCLRSSVGIASGACASDARIKTDIHNFDLGLEALLGIQPKYLKYNGLGGHPASVQPELGVIAQDVEVTAPSLVTKTQVKLHSSDTEKTEIKQVNYTAFTYVLINSVKELYIKWFNDSHQIHRELASKEEQIQQLQKENQEMKLRLERLEKALNSK